MGMLAPKFMDISVVLGLFIAATPYPAKRLFVQSVQLKQPKL